MTEKTAESNPDDDPSALFREDVLTGLSAARKTLPCKYFYDEAGSRLFEQVCLLPEYYPTRTERLILRENAGAIADACGRGGALIEPGAGSGEKTRLLLSAMSPAMYVPIDISGSYLRGVAGDLASDFPECRVIPVAADFTTRLDLPDDLAAVSPRTLFFPGSTIGNFTPERASALLRTWVPLVGANGRMLIGVDLVKPADVLEAAYDDAAGVTAEFNLNLLRRINRELGGTFDDSRFKHTAVFNADESRVEMRLVSCEDQTVRIGDRTFGFTAGESIHTENSHKYTRASFGRIATAAGLRVERVWTDASDLFSVQLLKVLN